MPSKEIYSKTPKTFEEQIALLKERNLEFENEKRAERILTYISYNRLSNYWFPMLAEPKSEEIFKDGSRFIVAFRLYQFDSELRKITFNALEQIEIAVRTQLIYHFSHKYKSGFWFADSSAFKSFPQFINVLAKVTQSTQESKQDFIVKYRSNYQQFLPPAWKSFELLTFNSLLTIVKNIPDHKDIIPISKSFGLNHKVFISWLESFVYIRNICAHHSRLWNIKLTISPTWLRSPKGSWVSRWENEEANSETRDKILKFYAIACCISYVLSYVNPYNRFSADLIYLLESFEDVDTEHMGFPENWREEPLWAQ